jgi:hypothetical protein
MKDDIPLKLRDAPAVISGQCCTVPPHPFGTGAAKQPSQDDCTVIHGLQHMSHTLHPVITAPHAAVLLRCPQLCGVMHLHVAMHLPGDWDPLRSSMHCPVVELQVYIGTVHVGGPNGASHWVLFGGRGHSNMFVGEDLRCREHPSVYWANGRAGRTPESRLLSKFRRCSCTSAVSADGTGPVSLFLCNIRNPSFVSTDSSAGIVPPSMLKPKDRTLSCTSADSAIGMEPVSEFSLKSMLSTCVRADSAAGMLPVSKFSLKSKDDRRVSFDSAVGMEPTSLLPHSCKSISCVSPDNAVGIVPVMAFSHKLKLVSCVSADNVVGRLPVSCH